MGAWKLKWSFGFAQNHSLYPTESIQEKIERKPKKQKKEIKFYFKQTPIWVLIISKSTSKVERGYLPVRLGALILANTETKFDQKHSKFNKAYQETYKFIEYLYKNRLMNRIQLWCHSCIVPQLDPVIGSSSGDNCGINLMVRSSCGTIDLS